MPEMPPRLQTELPGGGGGMSQVPFQAFPQKSRNRERGKNGAGNGRNPLRNERAHFYTSSKDHVSCVLRSCPLTADDVSNPGGCVTSFRTSGLHPLAPLKRLSPVSFVSASTRYRLVTSAKADGRIPTH